MIVAAHRLAGAGLAALGVAVLAACGNGVAGGTAGSSGASAPSRGQHTDKAPTHGPSRPTAARSPASRAPVTASPTTETAPDARLTFGEPAVIKTAHGLVSLTVRGLRVAPSSIYAAADLNKVNGTVYFVDYTVTPIKPTGSSFATNSVSGLFLYPTFAQGAKAKRLYGSAPGCTIASKALKPGQAGNGCYVYQITGARATTVSYNDYRHNLVWSR